ncbi:hypothetical protein N9383_00070 [Granulosicoccus sp.]|nr:hypothetical protein [Granulosicoccus sp.]
MLILSAASRSLCTVAVGVLFLAVNTPGEVSAQSSGIVFETDFSQNTGYSRTGTGGFLGGTEPPEGWDGVRVDPNSNMEVTSQGIGGSNALRLNYRQASSGRASMTLAKNLTGDANRGYNELYVRYNIKLPANFKAGANGKALPFWKWGRLWQNTSPEIDGTWTELREDAGYVVWGQLSSFQGNPGFYGSFADNGVSGNHQLGSNGGPMQTASWYRAITDPASSDGFFEAVGNGAWKFDDARPGNLLNSDQDFHTIEWRFKLASSADAEDGIFEIWIDGVRLIPFTYMGNGYGAPERTGVPTIAESSGGFNHFSLFDNMQGWSEQWNQSGVDGYILINDVVVSTERIGHDYVVSGQVASNERQAPANKQTGAGMCIAM